MNDVKNIAKLAEEASSLYQHHGSADTAALLLEKTGNMLSDSCTVDALRLFQKAADVALVKPYFSGWSWKLYSFSYLNEACFSKF